MNAQNLPIGSTPFRVFLASIITLGNIITATAQTNVVVAPIKMNVLYIGIDNPVSIAVPNNSNENITVSATGGDATVSKAEDGLYNIRVASITDDCLINVHVDGKLVGTSKFRVRGLPAPYATVGGFESGIRIPADVFKMQAGVGTYLRDFPFLVQNEVLEYTLRVEDEKGATKSVDCQGSRFSAEAKTYINEFVKSGSIVSIINIRAKDEGGRTMKLPSLTYHIQ